MNDQFWFRKQLQASGDSLVWAIAQVPASRRSIAPPEPLGEWTALRHMFHMYYNEKHIVLPRIRRWLEESETPPGPYHEEAAWQDHEDPEDLPERFKSVREAHIALIDQFKPAAWDQIKEIHLGMVSLRWVMTKSVQHTADHLNTILRMALFWDHYEAQA